MEGRLFKKKIIVIVMAISMVVSANASAKEAQIDTLVEVPPIASNDLLVHTYGSEAPGNSADVHNLSVSSYNYQAKNMGYRIYTSKWLKGAKKLKIIVENWTLLKSYEGAANNRLTLSVYDSDNERVTSKTITIYKSFGSATLTGLKKSKKYYVCFQVPTNGNRYSYNGTISAVN